MYFPELQMIEYDTRSVPEGEFRDFCHSGLLIGQSRANHASLSCLGVRRSVTLEWEVRLTKSLCFLPLGWAKLVFLLLLGML